MTRATSPSRPAEAAVSGLEVAAYTIPTDAPESDGTFAWDSTTIIVVHAHAGGETGLGYTYGHEAVGTLIAGKLADAVADADALAPGGAWLAMRYALRNIGQPGIGAMAVAAVDIALHDLRARLLGLPLFQALGPVRDSVAAYGSGGFTSYSDEQLREQLGGWAAEGFRSVKMKVGREPARDPHRIAVAREAIGDDVELMVDANGAFTPDTALFWARRYADAGITYFEEPVSSDDLTGLRRVRDRAPRGLAIAAGEYGWSVFDAERMLAAGAVDILQADVTRFCGISELERVDGLCRSHSIPFSAHCAPAVSAHACCALQSFKHLEYFHDHARLESLLFDGTVDPVGGELRPDPSRPGLGLELKRADAERYRA
jgi:L-alanine-DL-glutamate epimerase-like enolase superfamily enzyme